ncbi:15473_t:CDS:1, partial [Gigaspora margarita]
MDLGSKPDTSHFYKTKVITYNADSENLTAKMIVEDMTNYESCPEDNI